MKLKKNVTKKALSNIKKSEKEQIELEKTEEELLKQEWENQIKEEQDDFNKELEELNRLEQQQLEKERLEQEKIEIALKKKEEFEKERAKKDAFIKHPETEKDHKRIEELNKLISILGLKDIYNENHKVINGKMLRENHTVINRFYQCIPELKKVYPSKKLTSLHENSLQKQKFPAVNMLRQILRANSFNLKPVIQNSGYSWNKKLVIRDYEIELYWDKLLEKSVDNK